MSACSVFDSVIQETEEVAGEVITETPKPTSTPDVRVIRYPSKNLILSQWDLPFEGYYYLPSSSSTGPITEMTFINAWGEENANEYMTQTGWIEGHWVAYYRGSEGVGGPEKVYNSVNIFENTTGAQASVLQYNPTETSWVDENWTVVDIEMELGDTNITTEKRESVDVSKEITWYRITFSYRNVEVIVEARDWADQISHEFVENAARAVLARIEAVELVDP